MCVHPVTWMDLIGAKSQKIFKRKKTGWYHIRQHHLLVVSGQCWAGGSRRAVGLGLSSLCRDQRTGLVMEWDQAHPWQSHPDAAQRRLTHSYCKRAASDWVTEPEGCRCSGWRWKSWRVNKKRQSVLLSAPPRPFKWPRQRCSVLKIVQRPFALLHAPIWSLTPPCDMTQ